MGRIKGHYEWDDDDLMPGHKSGGGLHQNLFDSEGKLKGSARFVPDDGDETDPLRVTENVYVPADQRRRIHEEEDFRRAVSDLLVAGLTLGLEHGIAKAKPYVEQWWREKARPGVDAGLTKWSQRRIRRRRRNEASAEKTVADQPLELDETATHDLPQMSLAEAQARYLASLAARAYSDEQMRLVSGAQVVDGGDLAELKRSLAEVPYDQIKSLVETMATDPSLLSEETLAELASILGRRDSSGANEQLRLD